jgi:hypothetical protein
VDSDGVRLLRRAYRGGEVHLNPCMSYLSRKNVAGRTSSTLGISDRPDRSTHISCPKYLVYLRQ